MAIISGLINNYSASGVRVFSKSIPGTLMSGTTIGSADLSTSGLSKNLVLDVYSGGKLNSANVSRSIITVHNGGITSGCILANHTVHEVLYGGSATDLYIGVPVTSIGSSYVVKGVDTLSTVQSSSTHIITNGDVSSAGYTVYTSEVFQSTAYPAAKVGDVANGTVLVRSGGVATGSLRDGGKLVVEGTVNSVTVSGAAQTTIMPGGSVNSYSTMSDSQGNSSYNAIRTVRTRITKSDTFGIPCSGYPISVNGTTTYNWYYAADSAMSAPISNVATIVDSADRRSASVTLANNTAATGTFVLPIASQTITSNYFDQAKSAVWVESGRSSISSYKAIERSIHVDGYPYWDVNQVTLYMSNGTQCVSKTLLLFAPDYSDVIDTTSTQSKHLYFNNNISIESNGFISANGIRYGTTLHAKDYASANITSCSDAVITVNEYALLTCSCATDVKPTVNLMVPAVSKTFHGSSSVIVPNISIVSSAESLNISGNVVSGYIEDGYLVNTKPGASASNVYVKSDGGLIANSNVTCTGVTVSEGGILELKDFSITSNSIALEGAYVNTESEFTGTISASSGANIAWYITRNNIRGIVAYDDNSAYTYQLGYTPADLHNATWDHDATADSIITVSSTDSTITTTVTHSDIVHTLTLTRVVPSASEHTDIVYSGISGDTGVAIKDTSETLEAYLRTYSNNVLITEEHVGKLNIESSPIYGTYLSGYTVSGNTKLIVTDRVNLSGVSLYGITGSHNTVGAYGQCKCDIIATGFGSCAVHVSGYQDVYKHKPVATISAQAPVHLYVGNYANVSAYSVYNVNVKDLVASPALEATLTINDCNPFNGYRYHQTYRTTYTDTAPTGVVLAGKYGEGVNAQAGVSCIGVAGPVNLYASAYGEGCTGSVYVATSGRANNCTNGVTAAAGATVAMFNDATIVLGSTNAGVFTSICNLYKGLGNVTDMASTTFTVEKYGSEFVVGSNMLSGSGLAEEPMWANFESGYAVVRSGSNYAIISGTYNSDTKIFTRGSVLGTWTANTTLPYRNAVAMYTGAAVTMATYTSNYVLYPNSTSSAVYEINESTYVNGAFTDKDAHIKEQVYRTGKTVEGERSSALYHEGCGSWTNSGTTYLNSGIVVTTGGHISVSGCTVHAPIVLSGGSLYVGTSAVVKNLTAEYGARIDAAFGRGYFAVHGWCISDVNSISSGKMDDYIDVRGSSINGNNSTYSLSMVDTLTSGDDRRWTGEFVIATGSNTYSRYVTLYASNALWNVSNYIVSKYTDPVDILESNISSGTTASLNALLDSAVFNSATLNYSGGYLRVGDQSIISTVAITSTGLGQLVIPDSAMLTSDQSSAIPMKAMITTVSGSYVLATSDNNLAMYTYDSAEKAYTKYDVLDGFIINRTSSNVVLESGNHTRDPWFIYTKHSEYNTGAPTIFTGDEVISRTNTKEFEIKDLTQSYTIFRISSGETILTSTFTANGYVTRADENLMGCAVTAGGGRLYPGILKSCFALAGTLNLTAGGILDGLYFSSGWQTMNLQMRMYDCFANDVVVNSNCAVNMAFTGPDHILQTSKAVLGTSAIIKYPMVMSGDTGFIPSLTISARGEARRLAPIFDNKVVINAYGIINTPYLMSSGNIYHGNYACAEIENYYTTNLLTSKIDPAAAGSIACSTYYVNKNVYNHVVRGLVVTGTDSLSFTRNFTALNVSFDDETYENDILVSHSISYADAVKLPKCVWVTPNLSASRAFCANYVLESGVLRESDFTSGSPTVNYGVISTWHKPSFASSGSATVTGNGATVTSEAYPSSANTIYMYIDNCESVVVSNSILQVCPGATLGIMTSDNLSSYKPASVTLGYKGGIFVEPNAIAFDIDVTSVASSLVNMSSIDSNYLDQNAYMTHFEHINVLTDGIAIVKPTTGVTTGNTAGDASPGALTTNMPVGFINGNGYLYYGQTVSYSGTANIIYCQNGTSTIEYASNMWYGDLYNTTRWGFTVNSTIHLYTGSNAYASAYYETDSRYRQGFTVRAGTFVYIKSGATLWCGDIVIESGAALFIENGAVISQPTGVITVSDCGTVVLMDGNAINFNEPYYTYASQNGGTAASGVEYYTRTGTGSVLDHFVYTQITTTPGEELVGWHYYKVDNGNRWRFRCAVNIRVLKNFVLSNMPCNSSGYPLVDNLMNTPSTISCVGGYDVLNQNLQALATFTKTANYTQVSNVSYCVYSGACYNQSMVMSYTDNIVDPMTNSINSGWAIYGNYETEPGVVSSGILYACYHQNPIGSDWNFINGRYIRPHTTTADRYRHHYGHDSNDVRIYDCGYTILTGDTADEKEYPTIIHVNGYISGPLSANRHVGEAFTAPLCDMETGVNLYIHDCVINKSSFTEVTGTVKLCGYCIVDYHEHDECMVISGEHNTVMSGTGVSAISLDTSDITDTAMIRKYNIQINTSDSTEVAWPFLAKECNFSGNTAPVRLLQPCSAIGVSSATLKFDDKAYHIDVSSGGIISAVKTGKIYTARLSGGSALVTGYARNILVSSGGVLTILSGATADNIKILSGGSAHISGYVTGYEMETGAVVDVADSRYIRTSSFFDKEYTW